MTPVPGAPGYYASEEGWVATTWSPGVGSRPDARPARLLRLSFAGHGYPQVTMNIGGINAKRYVHDIIALTFIGPKPAGSQVRHLDGDKRNSRPRNLAYGTAAENAADSVRLGATTKGSRNARAKLSSEAVAQLRSLAGAGAPYRDLAQRFGITASNVSMIVNRKTWAHVA